MAARGLAAGAATVDITPRAPCTLAGYAGRNHAHKGVHIPLSLRALYVRGKAGREVLLVSADLIWFGEKLSREIRSLIARELGVSEAGCLLAGTHTHSAPDGANPEYLGVVAGKALAAAALAKDRARPARLSVGRGKCAIGINRREKRPDGTVLLGRNPVGIADRELIVVGVNDTSGHPIARIANFACHGVVLSQNNYVLSGDWPGAAAIRIEKRTKAPFLFLPGGAGNVNPKVGPQEKLSQVDHIADEFARDFFRAHGRLEALPGSGRVGGVEMKVSLPPKRKGRGPIPVRLHGIRLGPLGIVAYPGEMFSETAIAVKRAVPGRPLLVGSCVDASSSGYVPVKEAYADGGYEVNVTPFASGAEALLRRGLISLARRSA